MLLFSPNQWDLGHGQNIVDEHTLLLSVQTEWEIMLVSDFYSGESWNREYRDAEKACLYEQNLNTFAHSLLQPYGMDLLVCYTLYFIHYSADREVTSDSIL